MLGVDIITPGGNYIGPPRVKFIDSCNRGRGATGRAVMGQVPVVGSTTGETTLGITGVVIDDLSLIHISEPTRPY